MTTLPRQLTQLLHLYGVQPAYEDVFHRRQRASVDSLMAVLRCLGADVNRPEDAAEALRRRRHEIASCGIPPTIVAWDGSAADFPLTLPSSCSAEKIECHVDTPAGRVSRSEQWARLPRLPANNSTEPGFVTRRFPLPGGLPWGCHQLVIEAPTGPFASLVISAPTRAFTGNPSCDGETRRWGGFLPLYSFRSERNWGAGDLTDMVQMARWIGGHGGRTIGTLPLLAGSLEDPCDPSPYAPVSRLLWNEFYIDVTAIPELENCAAARELIESASFQQELSEARRTQFVQYAGVMRLKRRCMELLAESFHSGRPPRFAQFQKFLQDNPLVEDYAQFRAVCQRRRQRWQDWPQRHRAGQLPPKDYEAPSVRYYCYSQWIAAEQMSDLAREAAAVDCGLYLDVPLGVRADGYDAWRYQQLYANAATAGAPPDSVFTKGQDWGFPPLHPEAIRENGYQHLRQIIAHHMQFATQLRLDHVMGLHRLYWIPHEMQPHEGVFVRYRPEEMYAVLSLESHRHQCRLIGEDLGTVPAEVNELMERHAVGRMYVVQYELQSDTDEVLTPPSENSVASLNTHDMPTFAAWWNDDDLPDRRELGLLTDAELQKEARRRRQLKQKLIQWLKKQGWLPPRGTAVDAQAMVHALLSLLAAGPAEAVSINLEDLWLETQPQNMPGTSSERPNWLRKAALGWEEVTRSDTVRHVLQEVDMLRRRVPLGPATRHVSASGPLGKEPNHGN